MQIAERLATICTFLTEKPCCITTQMPGYDKLEVGSTNYHHQRREI